MSRNDVIKNIPNMCTLANAVCGIVALLVAVFYQTATAYYISCLLIAIGVVFDSIDGRLARRLKVSSCLGKELDSFADLITFVITPMCIFLSMHSMGQAKYVTVIEIIIAAFYISCGVFRLARYNVGNFTEHFVGLPTTSAGLLMSLFILISNWQVKAWSGNVVYSICSYVLVVLLGIAMVSNFKVKRV